MLCGRGLSSIVENRAVSVPVLQPVFQMHCVNRAVLVAVQAVELLLRPSPSVPVGWMASMLHPSSPCYYPVTAFLSQSQQGGMSGLFSNLPTVGHGALLLASVVNAVQLRLRLPLSRCAGITAMTCKSRSKT